MRIYYLFMLFLGYISTHIFLIITNYDKKQKGFKLNLDENRKNSPPKRRVQVLFLVVLFFILGLAFLSVNVGEPIQIGTAITVDGLESRWSEEYKLFLPGTIEKININTADQATLEVLPGVGEKIAEKIILYREQNGLFHSTDEIVNVSGIGIKKLNQMKEFIIVE